MHAPMVRATRVAHRSGNGNRDPNNCQSYARCSGIRPYVGVSGCKYHSDERHQAIHYCMPYLTILHYTILRSTIIFYTVRGLRVSPSALLAPGGPHRHGLRLRRRGRRGWRGLGVPDLEIILRAGISTRTSPTLLSEGTKTLDCLKHSLPEGEII